MDAFGIIALLVFIIGIMMAAYYGFLCLPMYLHDRKHLPRTDPERERIISDNEPNRVEEIGLSDNAVVAHPKSKNVSPSPYPSKADLEDAEEYNVNSPSEARPQSVDEIDHVSEPPMKRNPLVVPVNIQNRAVSEPTKNGSEKQRLLDGDDEDGLIFQPPHSGKADEIVVEVERESEPASLKKEPPNFPPQEKFYEEGSHVIVNLPEPQTVPPQKNMAEEHPLSHAVVSTPQTLSVVPIVDVPPVYDESPTEELSPSSLQDRYHSTPTLKMTSTKGMKRNKSVEDNVAEAYGWSVAVTNENPKVACAVANPNQTNGSRQSMRRTDDETDTSDPEETEYSFHVEDSSESKNEITMIRFTSIDESAASASDSLRVHTGNTLPLTDASKDCSPELSRRSPDGDSVKSLENEGKCKSLTPENIEKLKKSKVEACDSDIL